MSIPLKKLKNGFALPVYGLGTWQMGGRKEQDPSNDDKADILAIREAINNGVTHIDTAEIYAAGHAEELIAEATKDFDRKKLFIASKARRDLSYDGILHACTQSLKRLQTEYLDLYLLHTFDASFPLKDSIKALDTLVTEGKVRYIGVSNFSAEHLKEAQSYSDNPIVCNQVHYNLEYRESEETGLLEYCQKNDVMLVAYRPVEKGALLQTPASIMDSMCKKYQKTPAQIAINWLVSQDNVVTISKTRSSAHLEENLGALDWKMESADIELLRKEFPHQQTISNVEPLK